VRALGVAAALSLLGSTTTAAGETAAKVDAEVNAGWLIIGNGGNLSGGFGPRLAASYGFALSERSHLGVGAEVGVFGFGRASRELWVLGGPTVRLSGRPWEAPVALALTMALDFGGGPICNRWKENPLCPRFIGAYPSATIAGLYQAESGVSFGATMGAQVFNSSAGFIIGFTPSVVGVISFGRTR
jgi:hypothetical protein